MAPQEGESLPLVTKYGSDFQPKVSSPRQNRSRSTSSEELGTPVQKGTGSTFNVGLNIAKTAAGTGILALPYACKNGGLLLFVAGMFLITFWNVYCIRQLCETLEYLMIRLESNATELTDKCSTEGHQKRFCVSGSCRCEQLNIRFREPPPVGTSTFSKLGWYALGDFGRWTIDLMMLMLLLFINIALEVAILSFVEATPFCTGVKLVDGAILGLLLVPFCIVDDISALSKLSRLGLIILGFAMAAVAWYGFHSNRRIESYDETIGDRDSDDESPGKFNLYPLDGIEGVSKWFGCIVFSYGVVPLTFNFRESMAEPEKLPQTAMISMTIVGFFYIIIGVFFLHLFPNINDDLLAQMPSTGVITTATRMAMIVVVMASIPLLVIPCAQIIEGKMIRSNSGQGTRSKKGIVVIRASILLGTFCVAAKLPGFVTVLAFVGCFAVSMVSFVLPPVLHWLLLRQGLDEVEGIHYPLWSCICDVSMLLVGISTTIITTSFTGST